MDASEDVSLLFSDHRTAVCGFDSKTPDQLSQRSVRHREIATDPLPALVDRSTATAAHSDVGSQTTSHIDSLLQLKPGELPQLDAAEEARLAAWLRRIAPAVERELQLGATPLPVGRAFAESSSSASFEATAQQVISSSRGSHQTEPGDASTEHGCAAWLSVVTQDAPMLAISVSQSHSAWCDHSDATVEVFQPQRCEIIADLILYAYNINALYSLAGKAAAPTTTTTCSTHPSVGCRCRVAYKRCPPIRTTATCWRRVRFRVT